MEDTEDASDSAEGFRRCCLHSSVEPDTDGKIVLFKQDTLSDCSAVLKIRKQNSLKYGDFNLPIICDGISGFHLQCYRRFMALSKKHRDEKAASNPTSSTQSSSSGRPKRTGNLDNSVLFEKECLFCSKDVVKVNGVRQKLTKVVAKRLPPDGTFFFQENLHEYATTLEDAEMIAKIDGLDLGAREAWYHRICRTRYQQKATKASKDPTANQDSEWHEARNLHDDIFAVIRDFVRCNVVEKKEAYHLSELCELYRSNLDERRAAEGDVVTSLALEWY